MIDLVTTQQDLTWVLLSSDKLTFAQVKSYRALRVAQELDFRTMLITPRNNKVGLSIVVLMPVASAKHQNVDGPVLDWDFPVVILENDTINHTANVGQDVQGNPIAGTMVSAEEAGQIVMDVLHKEADERIGTYTVSGRPMTPEAEFTFPGVIGYRVVLTVSGGKTGQTRRIGPVVYAMDANNMVTLSCATPSAVIKYTLDGSSPTSDLAGNTASETYSQPFYLGSGGVLRAAAYLTGMNKSPTRYFVAP